MASSEKQDKETSSGQSQAGSNGETRRDFLKVAVSVSVILAAGGVATVSKSITERAANTNSNTVANTFPKVKVANMNDLQVNQPFSFNYPLDNEPNILVKLGQKAEGGVGPDGDIVAFSQICQHLGCLYGFQAPSSSPSCNPSYEAPGPEGYCCCHGSIYDFLNGGKLISGPSPRPQPQVILEIDSAGNIFATGMTPPAILGHNTGSNYVASDLQGGNPVG